MKTIACTCLTFMIMFAVITGCTTGNARLSEMTAPQIRDSFKIGVTTTEDIRSALGEPLEMGIQTVKESGTNGVSEAKLVWYYRYQKVSARFFTPFIPMRREDNLHGRLMLGFNSSNVLDHVDYYGDQ